MWEWLKNWGSGIQSGDVGSSGLATQNWYNRYGYQPPNYMIDPSALANMQLSDNFVDNDAAVNAFNAQTGLTAPPSFGGGGFSFKNLMPSNWTPAGVGMFGDIAGGLGSLSSIYFGAKNYGLTKDMMDFQKKLARANFSNQAAMAQKAMDRGRLYRRALGGVKGEPRTTLKTSI